MGFFEDLGRKVGEFTHEAKEAAADSAKYGCRDCGAQFHTAQETCPECGSENVVERAVESDDAGPDESGADEAGEIDADERERTDHGSADDPVGDAAEDS